MKKLKASIEIPVRFSEVDSMGIVWHGSYALYFEEAREEFGRQYDLGYMRMVREGFYAPLVSLDFNYKKPLKYEDIMIVEIEYLPSAAAKICFRYKIYQKSDRSLVATGTSTQVFLDMSYQLEWNNPDFYQEWKIKNEVVR